MALKYPIGIQNFEDIRENGYAYVDKTAFIYKLASEGKSYFLSRPCRFGKSLLVSTMDAYFSGKRELFGELAIEKLENENPTDARHGAWVQGPVIHLDFNPSVSTSIVSFRNSLNSMLSIYEETWGRSEADVNYSDRFLALMRNMYKKTGVKVTVLIDEYDKPLLSTMFDAELNVQIRTELKTFYSALKSADDCTRFVFLTGVTKFSHVSIFSDLNQLRDISMLSAYNEICGMTSEEICDNFGESIDNMAEVMNVGREDVMTRLSEWYDGYHFSSSGKGIFNPYSIINALSNCEFKNYWFDSATPTSLIETVKRTNFNIYSLTEGISAREEDFMSYRADVTEPVPLFYQSGYLTIKDYNPMFKTYKLTFPNDEVKYSFLDSLLPLYVDVDGRDGVSVLDFARAIYSGDVDAFMGKLRALLASVPYDDSRGDDKLTSYEHTFRTAVHLIFTLCGQFYRSEVHTLGGRCDGVMETADRVCIFEFKMSREGSADDALRQIDDRNYAAPYTASGKEIVKIGISFDSEKRDIAEWKEEIYGEGN